MVTVNGSGITSGERASLVEIEAKERRLGQVTTLLPYPLLVAGTTLSLIQPSHGWTERGVILALSAVAAAWMLLMYSLRSDDWRQRQVPMAVYFVGLLALATVLMQLDRLFFMYAVSGFVIPFFALSKGLAVVGVFLTSLVVNFNTLTPSDMSVETISTMLAIVGLQTLLIGAFGYVTRGLEERRRTETAELEKTIQENAGLHAQLLTQAREAGILDERQRLAGEIHDTLAQSLAGVVTQLEAARNIVDRLDEQNEHLDKAARLARTGLAEARRTVHSVGPRELEDTQLPDALAELVADWSASTGVHTELTATGTPERLHPEIEVTLLRVVQEAMANVAKHAQASRVGLTVSYMGDAVHLDVRDDGIGFNLAAQEASAQGQASGGYGLTGMRERVRRVAGKLEIEAEPGGGTALSASVPMIRPGGDQ